MWNSYDTRALCFHVFARASTRICVFCHQAGGFLFFILHFYVKSSGHAALKKKKALHHLTRVYISCDAARDNKRGVVFFKKGKICLLFCLEMGMF